MKKVRADVRLVQLGLAPSREKAKALIMAGAVLEGTRRVEKPGEPIDPRGELRLKDALKFVSRGGYKLEGALDHWEISLEEKICGDIGASTGGFTQCMLDRGAKKVYAIDVGTNQLAFSLRQDPRVISMEQTNIRYFDPHSIEELDFVSIDVSFISLALVLPVVKNMIKEEGKIVALIKPQFEAGKERVGKKGIVRDPKVHLSVLESHLDILKENRLYAEEMISSPIQGSGGNREFLALIKRGEFQLPSTDLNTLAMEE